MPEDEEVIEFEEAPAPEETTEETSEEMKKKKKKYPYPYEEASELEARLDNLEAKLNQIFEFIEELKKKKYPYPEEEAKKKKKYPYPYEEKQSDAVTQAIMEIKKQYESMSKRLDKLENTPARVTSNLSADTKVEDRVKQFLSNVTAGEVLVWAEKKGIKWGQGEV